MKKIVAALLSCILMLSVCSFAGAAQFSDVQTGDYFYDEAQTLSALGIVSGDTAGTLRPYAPLSRAEFAKLAAGMQNKLDEARAQKGASRFLDVDNTHWAVPYINYVAKTGIIVGYPDGTYHADEEITYAQAITVVLRVLGYDETAVEGFWPDSYVNKAAHLKLTEDMTFDPYASITRADAFVMIARALETEMYNAKTTLAASFGYSILENVVVLSTHLTDDALAVGEVKTASATYKCADTSLVEGLVGCKVKLYLNEKQEIAAVAAYTDYPTALMIKKHLGGNAYLCVSGGEEMEYRFSDSMTVYSKAGKSSYAQMSASFAAGAAVTLHGEQPDSTDYAYISDAEEITPVVATKDYQSGDTAVGGIVLTDMDNIVVYRDGYSAALTDIRANDVIYYNPAINTMEIYIDKVTGLYEQALPNKANVVQVVVGGRTFDIGSAAATRQLDESAGSFKIDDVVTLLLGKDGTVVGVCNTKTASVAASYGVLVSAGTYITDSVTDSGTTKYQIKIMMSDGYVYTYDAKKDYADYKGMLVRLSFDGSEATLTKITADGIYGDVSQTSRLIGTTPIASGAVIYDLVSNPDNGEAEVVKLDFEDLGSIYINSNSVLGYVKEGSFGEIAVVLFDNVMRTNVKYGVVEKVVEKRTNDRDGNFVSVTRTYTVLVDGARQTVSRNGTFSVSAGNPVMITYEGNQIDMLTALKQVGSANSIQALDYDRIKINNRIFNLCSDLLIYRKEGTGTYMTMSRGDLESANISQVTLYADFTNQVRAIKVSLK